MTPSCGRCRVGSARGRSLRVGLTRKGQPETLHRHSRAERLQAAEQIARGNVIAGDPQRCLDIIRRWRDALGLTVVSGTFYFGGMPQEMALRNIRLFAEEVMAAFVEAEAIAP